MAVCQSLRLHRTRCVRRVCGGTRRRWLVRAGIGGGGADGDEDINNNDKNDKKKNNEDGSGLDWEPERSGGARRRRRPAPSGSGFQRGPALAEPLARRRAALRTAAENLPIDEVSGSRRKTIAVVAAVAASVGFIAADIGKSDRDGNDMVSQELDLYMSDQGVVFGRTSLGDYIEFFKDEKGNPVIRDQQGNVYSFDEDENMSDEYLMEMMNRDGDAVFVPPSYLRKISSMSKTYSDDNVTTGEVEVFKAPQDISLFEQNGGILVPAEEANERRRAVQELMEARTGGAEDNAKLLERMMEEGIITEEQVKDEMKNLEKAMDEASKASKLKAKEKRSKGEGSGAKKAQETQKK